MPTINKRRIDTIMSLKKKIAAAFIACAMTLAVVPSAFACTALYVGSDLTEDGTTMFGRIEDLGTNDYNKLFNISPAGKHTAGEVYEGCYGFTYTFTHDSPLHRPPGRQRSGCLPGLRQHPRAHPL